jgi:hypothetical protein
MNNEKINPQRSRNYWEPIYGHLNTKKMAEYNGILCDQKNISNCHLCIGMIDRINRHKVKEVQFKNIDFSGRRPIDKEIYKFYFDNCTFELCSFRGTIFDKISFRDCKFIKSAFAFSTFNNCEFRKCEFQSIGISGNTTIFTDTYIESYELLKAVYLNRNKQILKSNHTSLLRQKSQLEKTKMIIARKLTTMAPVRYDLEILPRSIKLARLQEIKFDIFDSIYKIVNEKKVLKKLSGVMKFVTSSVSYLTVLILGSMGGWGQELGRALLIGVVVVLAFSCIYSNIIFQGSLSFTQALIRTFEYLFLFGYTKYSFTDVSAVGKLVIFSNSVFGMFWFAVMFPIIINKMRPDDD